MSGILHMWVTNNLFVLTYEEVGWGEYELESSGVRMRGESRKRSVGGG